MKHVLVYGMTSNPGGIETYVLNLYRRVHGKQVHFDFVSDFPEVSGGEELRAGGSQIHFIPAKSRSLWGHLKGMWRILRRHPEYETVYFNIIDAGAAITMLPAFLLGRRILAHSHNGSTDKTRLHSLCKPVLKCIAKGRAACSPLAAEFMFGPGSDALVIPNAVDGAKYRYSEEVRREVREKLGLGDRPVIVHVGRISRDKNPLGLIDMFAEIHARRPDAVLLSVGDGEMAGEFESYIQNKGPQDAVRRLGVRKDVPEILQAADAFLFPSLSEGLGIAVLEAQAAGLPCVISDTIPTQVIVTDLVRRVSLSAPGEVWAEQVLEALEQPRQDTLAELIEGGFDVSCCEGFDKKLLELF